MKKNKMILISIAGITIVLLALLGISYGYYLTRIEGNTNTNSILVTSADLSLKYAEDEDSNIMLDDIEPGAKSSKTFTVTNDGDSTVNSYGVYIEDVINTFSRTEDIEYKLTCVASKGTEELGSCGSVSNAYPTTNKRILTNSIASGVTHTYTFELEYVYLDDVNQSEDMGKTLGGKIQIYAESDVANIEGTVTGASEGDYILLESDNKTSQINLTDNSYVLTGVGVGSHTIKVMNVDSDGNTTTKGSKEIIIRKAQEARIDETTGIIYIDESSQSIPIDITAVSSTLTTSISKPIVFGKNTLAYELLSKYNGADSITEVTNFNTVTPGMYKAQDDYGTSYYYRGEVTNNIVKFAQYNAGEIINIYNSSQESQYTFDEDTPIYWRIIRINGDGTIRLLYDTSVDGSDKINGNGLMVCSNEIKKVGYMYGTDDDPYNNIYDSESKANLDAWYNTHLKTNYSKYLADTLYCNDREVYEYKNETTNGVDYTTMAYYAGYNRLVNNNPVLTCKQKNDRFTVSDESIGNGDLTYPIGMITADEFVMAGSASYLNSGYYQTMTPAGGTGYVTMFQSQYGGLYYADCYNGERAVINLKADVEFTIDEDGIYKITTK